MDLQLFTQILLAVLGFIGALMIKQLVRIADSVQKIHSDLKVLTNDHVNLKEEVKEHKVRINQLEKAQ